MSFEPDNVEHENEIESDNEQIIALLKRAVFLLEIIADFDPGSTEEVGEE
jgi:hypothetical protein